MSCCEGTERNNAQLLMRIVRVLVATVVLAIGGDVSAVAADTEASAPRLDDSFVQSLDAQWSLVVEDSARSTALLRKMTQLFSLEPMPRFPGLSAKFIRLAKRFRKDGNTVAARKTLQLACTIDECDVGAELLQTSISIELGSYYDALGHISSVVQKSWMLTRSIGAPLSFMTALGWAFVLACIGFWLSLLVKYIYGFGAALKANTELFPAWLPGLIPLILCLFLIHLGYGAASLIVGVVLLFPLLTTRERFVFLGTVALLTVLVGLQAQTNTSIIDSRAINSISSRFSASTHLEALLSSTPRRSSAERILIKQLRFGDADGVLRTIKTLEERRPDNISVSKDAGLLNSRGIAHGMLGESDLALTSFKESHAQDPNRFESAFNAFTVLKSMGKDDEAQAFLDKSLSIDAQSVGARVAGGTPADIEGFVYLGSPQWRLQDFMQTFLNGVHGAGACASSLLNVSALLMFGLLILCLLGVTTVLFLDRRSNYYFACPNCGKPTRQTKVMHSQSPALCDCCRLDVATASSLPREDLNRHEGRVRRWGRYQVLVSRLSLVILPAFIYVLTDAPFRALLFLALATLPTLGLVSAFYGSGGVDGSLEANLFLFAFVYLVTVIGARQRRSA